MTSQEFENSKTLDNDIQHQETLAWLGLAWLVQWLIPHLLLKLVNCCYAIKTKKIDLILCEFCCFCCLYQRFSFGLLRVLTYLRRRASGAPRLRKYGKKFPSRLCDPLPQHDYIMSAVTPHYSYSPSCTEG